jgi:NhaP-type Na+/H+ or K+/H+ antiporter/Trk K+ transport system NAD-binding subunit
MDHGAASSAALTIAVATAAGIVSQSVARTVRIPGIVVLLAVGVLLGPDVVGWLAPQSLGSALPQIVSFAVAVILFEGGMNLNVKRFRTRARSIRRLVTVGALITLAGGTLAARFVLGWDWRTAALFGALVIVTGPTVVTPLVRRFRLVKPVAIILEAEGLLIDAVGAVLAVVALEVAVEPTGLSLAKGVGAIGIRLGFGTAAGLAGGLLLWVLLRFRGLVAEGLENVFTLALVWALFHASNALLPESGIAAVTVAGMVMGNLKTPARRGLLEFNDQLTVMLIGMLFVVLAADVRLADVRVLGVPGLVTVAILVFVARPITVLASTRGCGLPLNQKAYISWIGPRGIIAAAVASLFATRLAGLGLPGGPQLKAMVFLVIAITVALAGLTGGVTARLLRVRREPTGWVLLGGNGVSCALAAELRRAGEEVVCIDSSDQRCRQAGTLGVEVIHGDGLSEENLHRARVEVRAGVAGLTQNDEVNVLFVSRAREVGNVPTRLAAMRTSSRYSTRAMLRDAGARALFSTEHDISLWSARMCGRGAVTQRWLAGRKARIEVPPDEADLVLSLVLWHKGKAEPVAREASIRTGDEVTFLLDGARLEVAQAWLREHGWTPVPGSDPESPDWSDGSSCSHEH